MKLWKMGSNPSKNEVVRIRISSSKQRERFSNDLEATDSKRITNNTQSKTNEEVNQLKTELSALRKELAKEKSTCEKEKETTTIFQEQLDEREREVLLLREELESLQHSHLTSTDNTEEPSICDEDEEERCDRTVHAKDQYIKSLEDELTKVKENTVNLNGKYQKKLRNVRSLSSKLRQDSSLKLFELKDENTKLVEEKTKLQERLERLSMDSWDQSRQGSASSRRSHQSREHDVTDGEDPQDDPRTKLILDLSQQVAALDSENVRLKQELRHSRKIAEKVEKVRVKAKRKSREACRNDMVYVDSNNADWSGLEPNHACVEVGE